MDYPNKIFSEPSEVAGISTSWEILELSGHVKFKWAKKLL